MAAVDPLDVEYDTIIKKLTVIQKGVGGKGTKINLGADGKGDTFLDLEQSINDKIISINKVFF
jgi:hypothetical protein